MFTLSQVPESVRPRMHRYGREVIRNFAEQAQQNPDDYLGQLTINSSLDNLDKFIVRHAEHHRPDLCNSDCSALMDACQTASDALSQYSSGSFGFYLQAGEGFDSDALLPADPKPPRFGSYDEARRAKNKLALLASRARGAVDRIAAMGTLKNFDKPHILRAINACEQGHSVAFPSKSYFQSQLDQCS